MDPVLTGPADQADDFVGMAEASRLLGLSSSSLQKLVDLGRLTAIKTAGGHRRILRSALLAYRHQMAHRGEPARTGPALLRAALPVQRAGFELLLVDDDLVTTDFLRAVVRKHFPDIVCTVARDGMEAILQLERRRPHLVISDLNMEPFDGFRLARLIHSKPEYAGICMLAMSVLSPAEIAARGGLPPGVLFHAKPIHTERLLGYLEGHVQALRQLAAG